MATGRQGPIRVLVVDDSAVVRTILTRDLAKAPGIEVVGAAPDPYVARDEVIRLKPDVLTLDVEMPRMDGISFLRLLMRHRPTPAIVVSSLTPRGSRTAIAAMEAGAIDVVCKPGGSFSVGDLTRDLIAKIRIAARARLRPITASPTTSVPTPQLRAMAETTNKLIALGASTGGVQALTEVVTRLPVNAPGTVIVQHMPQSFTGSFARRLNEASHVSVAEAKGGESVLPGHVLIAPGGSHMRLERSGARYYVRLLGGPPVHHQKPAVDVLFDSVATCAGSNAVGGLLTGMGADGAAGMLKMRQAGAHTIAQDEATSVVWGMPGEAVKLKAAVDVLPLEEIASALVLAIDRPRRAA
jgi:two-component system chemotaxis response regulator CheB